MRFPDFDDECRKLEMVREKMEQDECWFWKNIGYMRDCGGDDLADWLLKQIDEVLTNVP